MSQNFVAFSKYMNFTSEPWKNGKIYHRFHDKGFVSFYAICCVLQELMKCISELKIHRMHIWKKNGLTICAVWTQKPHVFWWTLHLMWFNGPVGSIKTVPLFLFCQKHNFTMRWNIFWRSMNLNFQEIFIK